MFINVTPDYIEYADSGIYPMYPLQQVLPFEEFGPRLSRLSDLRRVNKVDFPTRLGNELARKLMNVSDKIWFINPDMDTGCSVLCDRLKGYQVGSLDLLAITYECDHVDAEGLVRAGVDHDPAAQAWVNGIRAYIKAGGEPGTFAANLDWGGVAWTFAWLMNTSHLKGMHILQALGYDFDEAMHMDAHGIESAGWQGPGNATILAQVHGEMFTENVYLASKIALDSAQPVTIDVGPVKDGENRPAHRITFENVRLTPQVAGLRITLPTGGIVFLRDMGLHPETGDVARKKGDEWRRMAQRTLAQRLIQATARGLNAMGIAHRWGFAQPPILAEFWKWPG
jgi:hypothetical protein